MDKGKIEEEGEHKNCLPPRGKGKTSDEIHKDGEREAEGQQV